ncbi:alpha-D-xyloside xylohydrolase [Pedobacter psychrotolerans]|uniref:Alpha-D-xyloside xylohydrolase n=2 Tax=Pedobacter psychrotolerans TaxID=1843235 RepID=A0A4R2HLZ1_9SPHI|nr:TIM-barrel domain-containing protein [Pedobacter psychrotolerans]TCO31150.1 alpha-D-xyloside xylohydrolase [Pedobacter psychrotolerans]
MKRICLMFVLAVSTLNTFAQPFQKTKLGIKAIANGNEVELQFYTPSIVRVIKFPEGKPFLKESLSVTLSPAKTIFTTQQTGSTVLLKTEKINVRLDLVTGNVEFSSVSGKGLLKEKNKGTKFTSFNDTGADSYHVYQAFTLDKEEPIYGLGQHQRGDLNQRNQKYKLEQGNVEDAVPFFQSVKGYGLFWDNYSPTEFQDDADETSFKSQVGDGVDYYFMYGGNADGVIADMRTLTGKVPMFPLWTYGFWQSKERYKSQQELLNVVKMYRELNVPLDGIIQDWQYWGNNYLWNAMDFLNVDFPDGKKMADDVHAQNAHLIISIWSSFGLQTKPYQELDKKGMLYNIKTWPESGSEKWPPNLDYPSGVRVYDAYNPEARDIYWKYANNGLLAKGIDGWWMDSTEPDHLQIKPADYDTKTYLGSFRKVRNAYPLMAVGGVYDHQRKTTSDKRVFILTRSAFAGQQRYGANTWSGDTGSSWDTFRKQIPAGLNFSLTGIPHWNSDIGGFFAGAYNKAWGDGSGSKNPLYQELYVRWLQFGTFNPMMRSHGTDVPREIYQFGKKGEPIYDAIDKFINLRYTLLPYIYSTSWAVTAKQSTFMRALFMDFVDDKKVWDINNEYMFGQSILVAPVVKAQYTPETIVKVNENSGWNKKEGKESDQKAAIDFTAEKSSKVYLPAGTLWYDFWTNEQLKGGQELIKKTTIDIIPLYIKAGAIIPMGPKVQYATQQKWDNLEVKVYPGANGSFILYEDELDNYNYEKGAYTEIEFNWNDAAKKLTIANRKGSYKGMLQNRKFAILLPSGAKKNVTYTGKKIEVKF